MEYEDRKRRIILKSRGLPSYHLDQLGDPKPIEGPGAEDKIIICLGYLHEQELGFATVLINLGQAPYRWG